MNCDIAIIGGGPVGCALALALLGSKLKVCVLESRPVNTPSTDARALALSYGSRLLLERLGVWGTLQQVTGISRIHISQKQSFGRAMLTAKEMKVPELGYVLPYSTLQDALSAALQDVIYGASVTDITGESEHAVIEYRQDGVLHRLEANLAVVADGGRLLAERYPPKMHDYGQSALICHVTCSDPKTGTAFERFTSQGPIALLPYKEGYEIVWTGSHIRVQEMMGWDEARFLQELHQHFGDRVGEFISAGARSCYPLGLKRATAQSPMPHTVLIGNAAQTMHPVAGQGFNLGLRDAWDLAQEIHDAKEPGSAAMLEAYCSRRRFDREAGISFTDGLVRLFSNDVPALSGIRSASLSALDCLPLAKRFVARRMMFGANG